MKRIILVGVAVILGGLVLYLYGGSTPPAGQHELVRLNSANFGELRQAFNADPDRVRLIVLLSPTCPFCLEGASSVQKLLTKQQDQRIGVFVVWEPVLPTDWTSPSTASLARMADHRVQQYWDKGRLLSKAMGEKDNSSIVWDSVAVYPPGAVWSDAPPKPSYQDGPVVDLGSEFSDAVQHASVQPAQGN